MVRALSAYHLSHDTARHVIRMLRSIVHGCVSLEHIGGVGLHRRELKPRREGHS